mmetsp:Transcript_89579/g.252488  ORF Transcript_89579/g.252488 Transcript_89579/m.252488 type:complete len:238 (-) Transcript_89579:1187-1900(-)
MTVDSDASPRRCWLPNFLGVTPSDGLVLASESATAGEAEGEREPELPWRLFEHPARLGVGACRNNCTGSSSSSFANANASTASTIDVGAADNAAPLVSTTDGPFPSVGSSLKASPTRARNSVDDKTTCNCVHASPMHSTRCGSRSGAERARSSSRACKRLCAWLPRSMIARAIAYWAREDILRLGAGESTFWPRALAKLRPRSMLSLSCSRADLSFCTFSTRTSRNGWSQGATRIMP